MKLRGAGLSWEAIDAIYGRPSAPVKMTMDMPQTTQTPVFPGAITSPVAQMPAGFYERNTPMVSPSATMPVQAEAILPMPAAMPTAGQLEPESLVQQLQSAQPAPVGAGLLVTLALAFLMR